MDDWANGGSEWWIGVGTDENKLSGSEHVIYSVFQENATVCNLERVVEFSDMSPEELKKFL